MNELIVILNQLMKSMTYKHSMNKIMMKIMIMRFLLCVIMLVSKRSLVIGSIRLDIADPDILAHVVLLDSIKQLVS